MAGDWIKMRVNLVSHPKVLAIAQFLADDAEYQSWSTMSGFVLGFGGNKEDDEREYQASLRVTRYVTVCALLRFWGYANEHAKDEFIGSLRLRDIDDVVQVPGFGAALESIGWAEYDAEKRGLLLPNFNEYNTSGSERSAGAKSSAQRQKEYRDRKKAAESDVTRDATSDVTSNRREEKRREDIEEPTPSARSKAMGSRLPEDWVLPVEWQQWAEGERPDLEITTVACTFRDFWVGKVGKDGRKADWQATWRNWVRNQRVSAVNGARAAAATAWAGAR